MDGQATTEQPSMPRPRERSARQLGGAMAASLLRRRSRGSDLKVGLVLVHHEVATEQGTPGRDVVPAQSTSLFEGQLDHLRRH